MRVTTITFTVLLLAAFRLSAQTRIICGRVISELDKDPLAGVVIKDKNYLTLGQTDSQGRFQIKVGDSTKTLASGSLGFEPANIFLTKGCDTVEVVMIDNPTRDFMSPEQIDRERLSNFKKLPDAYSDAYQKGMFTHPLPCYARVFEPWWPKPKLDSIRKLTDKQKRKVKLTFKSLKVGDTISVPFYRSNPKWPKDTAILAYCSFTSTKNDYDYIFQCIVVDKTRQKRGYNLVLKITKCELCKNTAILQGKLMEPGATFTYNMRYHKVLKK